MKKKSIIVLTFILTGIMMISCQPDTSEYVRHVVVFKYKPEATEAQIKEITDAFRELKNKVPGIVYFETGVNNSPENLNQDFTHVYLLTFENAEARDNYLPHPEHKEFGKTLRESGIFDGVFVVDYQIEK